MLKGEGLKFRSVFTPPPSFPLPGERNLRSQKEGKRR